MDRADRKTVRVYPWEMSATGSWSPETGIFRLRDDTPEQLAELLWNPGSLVQNTAMVELMAHGNPRKAAQLARALVSQHPIAENSIREGFGPRTAEYLLKVPLERIPGTPSEYPKDTEIEYIKLS